MNLLRKALLPLLLLLLTAAIQAETRLGNDVAPRSQSVTLSVDPRTDDYTGSVLVELAAAKAASTFRFHAEDLTITALKLTKGSQAIDVTYAPDKDATVLVTAKEPLQPGSYQLAIEFTNKYNRQAVGLYKMSTKDGEPYLFTQFEAIDARRAFPCWDEPDFKIPYTLTVSMPALYDAVSNTPVASEGRNGETKTIRFATTKPLPSYLIALAVGQFDYTPINGMSVPGRIVSPKGQGALAKHAAEVAPGILAALETYFGRKYPFEKIDLIAVPEYWAGAMENPGAITYRDTVLLIDSNTATPSQRLNQIRITAHELAHMWFGDLVTMEWWDDLWLNESFADWMGDKITYQLYPDFGSETAELQSIQQVMGADAHATTDPIRKRDTTAEESIRNVGIAYNKGKAVLTMFEKWIGPEKFRQGVLAHLKANEWSNANAGEFFSALGKVAPAGTVESMQTFINQPGIPLVKVELTGPNEIKLTQSRFSNGAPIAAETWRIPVTIRYSDGSSSKTAAIMLDAPSKTVKLDAEQVKWVFPHAGAAGYYRWQLSPEALAALAAAAPEALTANERLAFIGNTGALFRSGVLHGDAYLDILARFANDPDPNVMDQMMGAFAQIRTTFDSPETRPLFAAYVRRTLGPALDRIGMTPRPGEPETITILRPDLLTMLAVTGDDPRVWDFVRESLPKYMENPASVHPTLAATVLGLAASKGDAALFDEFKKRFENATVPADRSRYLAALGRFRDPALKNKARDYSMTGAVRPNEFFLLWGGADTAEERDEYFDWATSHFEAIMRRLPPAFAGAMAQIAGGCEPERIDKARAFFAEKKVAGTERGLARVSEQVNECAALRKRDMAVIQGYLAK
jgi:alanyl aminopeptidase